MAAGFTINPNKIDNFRKHINEKVNTLMNSKIPKVSYIATSVIPISACTL